MTATATYNKSAWLGDYPIHWKVLRAKYLFDLIDERSEDGSEELMSVSEHHGVIKRKEANVNMFMAETYEGYKLCQKGDLVINSLWAWSRGLGFANENGIVSTAYGVFRFKILDGYNYHYFHYLLRTKRYVGQYMIRSKGIWISRLSLSDRNFQEIPILIPPLTEQNQIVHYIQSKEEKITRFIAKKQRFIELLKEQRQSVINEAVTKGIDKNVKLKDSGIKWLGNIPENWEVKRLKNCIHGKLKYGANESGFEYNPSWYRYIRITDFTKDGYLDDENKLSLPIEIGIEYNLIDGDILFARSGATVGKTFQFRFTNEEEKYCYAGYLIKASPNEDIILSDFLMRYTNSIAFENWKNSIFNKATIENIGADKYCTLKIPIPSIEEQKQILEFIKTETATIGKTIAKAEKEIELIKEYKEAMIAEAVMGKIAID